MHPVHHETGCDCHSITPWANYREPRAPTSKNQLRGSNLFQIEAPSFARIYHLQVALQTQNSHRPGRHQYPAFTELPPDKPDTLTIVQTWHPNHQPSFICGQKRTEMSTSAVQLICLSCKEWLWHIDFLQIECIINHYYIDIIDR